MRTSGLLPLLRSRQQGDLLALLYLHPNKEYSLTEAADAISASVKTVHHEVNRLEQAGIVRTRRIGNVRLVRAATDTPLARPLTDLLAVTYGPGSVLGELLSDLAGVEEAYIYGSWAARHAGDPGPVPNDVDVIVVGTIDPDLSDELARAAEAALRRPVNITRVSADAWEHAADDPFLATVTSQPMHRLHLRAHGEGRRDTTTDEK